MNVDRYARRLAAVTAQAEANDLAAVVVGPSPDLVYLTGYDPMPLERATLLVLRPAGEPLLVVPELERPLAAASPAASNGAIELAGWVDGADPYSLVAARIGTRAKSPIAVGIRLWASHLLGLESALAGSAFVSAEPTIGAVRAVKDAEELGALRRAAAAADDAYEDVCATRFEGRTERQVADDLGRFLLERGHDRVDFTIVAAGPSAASAHHEPGDRRIGAGDPVVMDFGGVLDGYCSDTTRTVSVGPPTDDVARIHDIVLRAQEAGCDAVRPGAPIQSVDRAARTVIRHAGFAERFVHRTGHGIGIEVHESPSVIEGNTDPLRPGMTFSVEPGIYLEGRLGVRIEDIVAVTGDGIERLNTSPRELRVVA